MYNFLVNKIFFPTYSFFRKNNSYNYYKYLKKTEWWKKEELDDLQNMKFKKMIEHIYKTVPFYNRYFKENNLRLEDFKSVSNIQKLPIVTKTQIRQNLEDFTSTINEDRLYLSTGGSTGEPFRFYMSKSAKEKGGAATLRGREYTGYVQGDKILKLWSSRFDLEDMKKLPALLVRKFRRTKVVDVLKLDEETILNYIKLIKKYRPKVIFGYTNSFHTIASYILRNDIKSLNVPILINGAETLFPNWIENIEKAFGGSIYNHYATRESSLVSDECTEKNGCHISMENGYIEIIKNTKPAINEKGSITITDFNNFSMPLIRYEIGDIGLISDEECSCGRAHTKLKNIEGRISDFITSRAGNVYSPLAFMWLFYQDPYKYDPHTFLEIKNYQIIQESLDKLIINIVPTDEYSEKTELKIRENFNILIKDEFDLEIRLVNEIPLTKSGKRRYVISKIRNENW